MVVDDVKIEAATGKTLMASAEAMSGNFYISRV